MPVYRFNSFDEARRSLWLKPGDPRLEKAIRWVWALGAELAGHYPPPQGLRKFRSIEEADADRKKWEAERSRFLRARHRHPKA